MEKTLETIAKKLTVNPERPEGASRFCGVSIWEPRNEMEARLGRCYLIAEIKSPNQDPPYLFNLFSSVFQSSYYEDRERDRKQVFEGILRKFNSILSNLEREGELEFVKESSFALGVIDGVKLYLAFAGDIACFLKYRHGVNILTGVEKPKGNDAAKEKRRDAAGTESEKEEQPHIRFTEISSGILREGDIVFIATKGLFSIFDKVNFLNALTESETIPMDKIEGLLKAHPGSASAAAISLEVSVKKPMENLVSLPNLTLPKLPSPKISALKAGATARLKITALKKIALSPASFFSVMKHFPRIPLSQEKLLHGVLSLSHSRKIPRLLASRRIALALSIIVVLMVAAGIMLSLRRSENPDASSRNTSYYRTVLRERKGEIEKLFIYKDTEGAKKLILDTKTLLAEIHESGVSLDEESSAIETYFSEELNRLEENVVVQKWETVFDLGTLPFRLAPAKLFLTGDWLSLFDETEGMLLRFHRSDARNRTIILAQKESKAGKFGEDGIIILQKGSGNVALYRNGALENSWNGMGPKYEIVSVSSMKNTAYLLSAAKGNILSLVPDGSDIVKLETVIQDLPRLKYAKALSRDETAFYVGAEDGKILVYRNGFYKGSWQTPQTPRGAFSAVYTEPTFQNVYALDGQSKKIAVFKKDGSFLHALTSEAWKDPLALTLTSDEKTMYLLDDNRILAISLP